LLTGALLVGCGGSNDHPARVPDELVEGRKPLIFEPGPIFLEGPLRDQTLDEIVNLGADTVRVTVYWNGAAPATEPSRWDPTDPDDRGYDFAAYDGFVRAAAARNLRLLMTIAGPAPPWAGSNGNELSPDPERFGEFAAAVASRYEDDVELWSVWNEPNISIFLQPQLRDGLPYSPLLYRELYLAAQEEITAADPGASILIGETAPTRGLDGVDPIPFAEAVLCLDPVARQDPACEQGEIDPAGWATHPYSPPGVAPFEDPPGAGFVTLPSLANLEQVLDEAAAAGTLAPDLPIYVTEYGIQSEPDPTGVSLPAQADYLSIAERLAYDDPRIASFAQYLLRDDPPDRAPGVRFGGFESGLRFFDGPPKPSLASFRLPLVVRREEERVSIWGLVRPARGATEFEIHVADGGRKKLLRRAKTDQAGTFVLDSRYLDGRLWQLRWSDPEGDELRGPWTRAYEFELPE
jgi:hypothetical protein